MITSYGIRVSVCLCLAYSTACRTSAERSKQALAHADLAYRNRDYAAARKSYSEASKLDKLSGRAYLGLARTNLKLGKPDEAEPALVRAMDTLQDWPSLGECYVALTELYIARHATDLHFVEGAERMAAVLLAHDARSFDGHRTQAEAWNLHANLETSPSQALAWRQKALTEFEAADAINPNDPSVLIAWAAARRAGGDYAGAKDLYLRAQTLEPANASILEGLYAIALKQRDSASAARYVSTVASLKTRDEAPLLDLAKNAIATNRLADARTVLTALATFTSQPDLVAALLMNAGDSEGAVAVWRKASARYPARAAHFLEQAAENPALLGNDEMAMIAATECLTKLPDDKVCGAVKTYEAYQRTERREDLGEMERLAYDNPGSATLRWYLGRMYQRSGRLNDARFQFNLGLVAHPGDPHLRLALAQLELASNAPEAARSDAQRLLSEDPRNPVAREILNQTAPDRRLR